MTALTLRIDADAKRIPTAVYEWDREYRHLVELDVRDCGDHLEIVGTPQAHIDNVVARWHESWREAFESNHGTASWATGIEPMPLGKKADVFMSRIVETEARFTGIPGMASQPAFIVTEEQCVERIVVQPAEAWQPGGEYDGFYDPTIELPHVAAATSDAPLPVGFGEKPWDKFASAIDPGLFWEALGYKRIAHLIIDPHAQRIVGWVNPLHIKDGVVRGVDVAARAVLYFTPALEADARNLGLSSKTPQTSMDILRAWLEDDYSLSAKIAARFATSPTGFVEWLQTQEVESAHAFVLAARLLLDTPAQRRTSRPSNASFESLRASYDDIRTPADLGVSGAAPGIRASDILMLVANGNSEMVIKSMTEALTNHNKNGIRP